MKRNTRILVALLLANTLTAAAPAFADGQPESYGATVGRKVTSSLANLTTGVLEIPKNYIIAANDSNFMYGIGAAVLSGGINTLGRFTVGILDLVTAPIPTKPVAYPVYIWDDFDVKTTYGPIFRMQND